MPNKNIFIQVCMLLTLFACNSTKEELKKIKNDLNSTREICHLQETSYIISDINSSQMLHNYCSLQNKTICQLQLNSLVKRLSLQEVIENGIVHPLHPIEGDDKIHYTQDLLHCPSGGRSEEILDSILQLPICSSIYSKYIVKDSSKIALKSFSKEISNYFSLLYKGTSIERLVVKGKYKSISKHCAPTTQNYMGWHVLSFDHQYFLWNIFKSDSTDILVVNSVNKLNWILVTLPEQTPMNLFDNPLLATYIRSNYASFNSYDIESYEEKYKLTDFQYKMLVSRELKSLLPYLSLKENTIVCELHDRLFPNTVEAKIWNTKPIGHVDLLGDLFPKTSFSLQTDSMINIYSNGHNIRYDKEPYAPRTTDFIDLCIRSDDNEKIRIWETFYCQCPYRKGRYKKNQPFPNAYKQISGNQFIYELQIPWAYINKVDYSPCPINLMISYSDADSLSTISESFVANRNGLSRLHLVQEYDVNEQNKLTATRTLTAPLIDGVKDSCWRMTACHPMDMEQLGKLESKNDFEGHCKILWDNTYLYVLVSIEDQVIHYPYVLQNSYSEIKNADNHQLVWRSTHPYNDDSPFYFKKERLLLKKGNYELIHHQGSINVSHDWGSYSLPSDFWGTYIF